MIKVAIADGHRLVRTGLTMLINEQKDMTVVGQAKNSVETLEIVNEFTPHVLLVDGQMLEHNCYEVMKKTSEHHDCCHMIIIANDHDPNLMYDVFKHGAVGFLLKSDGKSELITAIRAVANDDIYIKPNNLKILFGHMFPK